VQVIKNVMLVLPATQTTHFLLLQHVR